MDDELRRRRDASLARLEDLIGRGLLLRNAAEPDALGAWQRDCAAAIRDLSGGSKTHWLSRAYSEAFLVRSPGAAVIVEADPREIVERILGVLAQGTTSLSQLDGAAGRPGPARRTRSFAFVHDSGLRAVLEQTFADSEDALDRGEFGRALVLGCGVLEALLTDALARTRPEGAEGLADRSFEERIAAAERAGVVGSGCSRLPSVARRYRELTDADGAVRPDAEVSEGDARVAAQVLRVVLRDLDPGR